MLQVVPTTSNSAYFSDIFSMYRLNGASGFQDEHGRLTDKDNYSSRTNPIYPHPGSV